ncbi:MAG: hypothetical protein ABI134_10540 [Byssovorax sp.]
MVSTRIDTAKLKLATEQAAKKIEEANALLAPYLVVLSDQERAKIPRTRDGFDDATRSLARGIEGHANVIAATDFDGAAVLEDLDNVKSLTPVLEKIVELNQRIADSQLVWRAEAWTPALLAYGVAKVLSRTNAALRSVVDPLAAVFATHRARASKPQEPTEKK